MSSTVGELVETDARAVEDSFEALWLSVRQPCDVVDLVSETASSRDADASSTGSLDDWLVADDGSDARWAASAADLLRELRTRPAAADPTDPPTDGSDEPLPRRRR